MNPVDPVEFDFELETDPFSFEELQWLPLPLPTRGGGPADLRLHTRNGTIIVEATDSDVRVDDSRVQGSFSVALELTPRFESLDVRLDPLRLALVDEVLERDDGMDGFLRGTVKGSGPITLLSIDADLSVEDPPDDDLPPASFVQASGGIAIVEPRRMADLGLTLREFEPRWAGILVIETTLTGRSTGTATFDGIAGGRFTFDAHLSHSLPDRNPSGIAGGVMVDLHG